MEEKTHIAPYIPPLEWSVLSSVCRAVCTNCLNTRTLRAQLVSSITSCIPHQFENERRIKKEKKNQPKAQTHKHTFCCSSLHRKSCKVSVCGTRVDVCCWSHYKLAHQQLSGSFLRRWSGRGSWKAKQTGGLQICTRVESMKQVHEALPGRLRPPAGFSAPSRPSRHLRRVFMEKLDCAFVMC